MFSFLIHLKGTLSSEQICEIAKEKVEKHFPGAETACVPVADGGEGSVDAFITALGGSKVTVKVKTHILKIWTPTTV